MADKTLASLTAATAATGGLFYGTQSAADRKFTLTAAGASLAEAVDAAAQRTALGLDTAALLGAANVFTEDQTIGTGKNLLFQTDGSSNIGANEANRPNTIYCYALRPGNIVIGGGDILLPGAILWSGGTIIETPSGNGTLKLSNYNRDDFGRLQFGGTTSSFPSLKRSSAAIQCRLADDSDYADFAAKSYNVNGSAGASGSANASNTLTIVGGIITNIA